ncbi:hypothetical protein HON86_02765 [Candidatus Woesearchaeota archaeon]|jgi:uncharacterized membrane protein (UPF0127 family)|nr:hypothetical protein [Candidatus Woesearchaeota archaeon]MBT4835515.1 hypothetical protein [Candidatus Woesearchaeota archaeon]MBT6734799.1 hypothetical protein [Candidatus Woesearchaeota archaeon]MBT7169975.1 hypothetical protein [Candidatus Woesearchaeota archaeon]MBT7474487.1 hypothetical protein [Candidatus Woesearchaeota archaeon]
MKIYCNEKFVSTGKFINPILGLMFRRVSNISVLDIRKFSGDYVHMLFVFNKLDVVCLDENFKVIKVVKGLLPFVGRFFVDCAYILEFKSEEFLFKKGDSVVFK